MSQIWCRRDRAGRTFGAIPFSEVLKRTPEDLKQRPNAMYVSIAIPWCDAPHQKVSCRLLLRQLAHGSTDQLNLDTSRRLSLRQFGKRLESMPPKCAPCYVFESALDLYHAQGSESMGAT